MADSTSGLRIFLHPHAKEKEDGLHQHVKAKERVYVSNHADRNRIIEIFRGAMQHPGLPSAFALQTVKEAIKPVKQTVLIQDENQSLENALRTLLQELVVVATVATPVVVGAPDESQKQNSALDIVQDQDGGQSEADVEAGDDEMEGGEIKEESNDEFHKILKD